MLLNWVNKEDNMIHLMWLKQSKTIPQITFFEVVLPVVAGLWHCFNHITSIYPRSNPEMQWVSNIPKDVRTQHTNFIGLAENFKENTIFDGKNHGFRWRFSLENQSNDKNLTPHRRFLSHRGTPSHHPFGTMRFSMKETTAIWVLLFMQTTSSRACCFRPGVLSSPLCYRAKPGRAAQL